MKATGKTDLKWPRKIPGEFLFADQSVLIADKGYRNYLKSMKKITWRVPLCSACHYDLCRDSGIGRRHAGQMGQRTSSTPASLLVGPHLAAIIIHNKTPRFYKMIFYNVYLLLVFFVFTYFLKPPLIFTIIDYLFISIFMIIC